MSDVDSLTAATTPAVITVEVAPEAAAEICFADLQLAPEILRAIEEAGYTRPTPIQAKAIPLVLSGKDIMGGAQTGTGKTAAFTLPLLQKLVPFATPSPSPARHPVRALILAPTRELALQVFESVQTYSKHLPIRALCVFGGVDIKPQIETLRKGVEILVATPGRLLDHVEQKSVNFSQVQTLILDEADRMLDMGFIPDITRILKMLPTTRQSLLFSATFSEEIKKLADTMLKAPVLVEVAKRNTVSETITHRVHPVAEDDKRSLLISLLKRGEIGQCIVFVKTKQGCSRLSRELVRAGIAADAIHGDKSQLERIKALDAFKQSAIQVLVATDVAARGIDIDELPHVINYELPHVPEDYVHRIGRTGRAGRMGNAISLVSSHEVGLLVEIEKLVNRKIEQNVVPGFAPDADYEYPPNPHRKKSKTAPAAPSKAPYAQKPERGSNPYNSPRSNSGNCGGNHSGNSHPRSHGKHRSHIAADGFDFSKPYEPRGDVPVANPHQPVGNTTPHKPRKVVAALLGGLGRKV
jgi:ATP-dependent RNA helicase RhlE